MTLNENIAKIKDRITQAAIKVDRDQEGIKLLAVTKTRSIETIEEALSNNIEFIGENKVQEAEDKIPSLEGKFKEFHFIGHLQSNKINKLMKKWYYIKRNTFFGSISIRDKKIIIKIEQVLSKDIEKKMCASCSASV